jgi:putative ABC transport system ATP-binding protein
VVAQKLLGRGSESDVLQLEQVVKRYSSAGDEVRAVDGVSLRVRAGEMLALHGPSGSGKTTLLLLIAALLRPDSGSIRYRGRELGSLSEAERSRYLRRDVGFVYQSARLMPRVSALENATVKLLLDGVAPRAARARVRPWLARLGLSERMAHTPEQLSAGERQRLAIARALAGEPALLLADEPTANLDSARSRETVALLAQIAHEQGASVVLVTHDTEAAALADRDLRLQDGRLVDGDGGAAGAGGSASGTQSATAAPTPPHATSAPGAETMR